jgi:hypothetical protein
MCGWRDSNHAHGIETLMLAIETLMLANETLIHVKNRNKNLKGYH